MYTKLIPVFLSPPTVAVAVTPRQTTPHPRREYPQQQHSSPATNGRFYACGDQPTLPRVTVHRRQHTAKNSFCSIKPNPRLIRTDSIASSSSSSSDSIDTKPKRRSVSLWSIRASGVTVKASSKHRRKEILFVPSTRRSLVVLFIRNSLSRIKPEPRLRCTLYAGLIAQQQQRQQQQQQQQQQAVNNSPTAPVRRTEGGYT